MYFFYYLCIEVFFGGGRRRLEETVFTLNFPSLPPGGICVTFRGAGPGRAGAGRGYLFACIPASIGKR